MNDRMRSEVLVFVLCAAYSGASAVPVMGKDSGLAASDRVLLGERYTAFAK